MSSSSWVKIIKRKTLCTSFILSSVLSCKLEFNSSQSNVIMEHFYFNSESDIIFWLKLFTNANLRHKSENGCTTVNLGISVSYKIDEEKNLKFNTKICCIFFKSQKKKNLQFQMHISDNFYLTAVNLIDCYFKCLRWLCKARTPFLSWKKKDRQVYKTWRQFT